MSPITLLFAPSMRVGGEVLLGEVELRFPQIIQDDIEEVHVKLRGKVSAKVARQFGHNYQWRFQQIELARENVSVWTKGSAYPPSGSEVLRVPFRLQLPLDVQPSFQMSGYNRKGVIGYFIEAVGIRKGVFVTNRRVVRPFVVVPNDPAGAISRESLQGGWTGAFNTVERVEKIRKGLWGDYSDIKIELKTPQLRSFPLFTKIPITLRIITTTKEMKYSEKDEHEKVFPEPPRHPEEVEFLLRRITNLNARGWSASDSETIAHLGGMGKAVSAGDDGAITTFGKKWVPSADTKTVGTWSQEMVIQSAIELKSTPSFSTPVLKHRSYLRIRVGFSGFGNNIEANIPIEVSSGLTPPSAEAPAPPYDGPSAALDLPPTYWTVATWDDGDEKGGSDSKS